MKPQKLLNLLRLEVSSFSMRLAEEQQHLTALRLLRLYSATLSTKLAVLRYSLLIILKFAKSQLNAHVKWEHFIWVLWRARVLVYMPFACAYGRWFTRSDLFIQTHTW